MKRVISFFFVFVFSLTFITCEKITSPTGPNVIGGETNIPLNTVGNTINASSIQIGGNNYDMNEQIKVIKNENGVTTFHVKADVPNSPEIQNLINKIPVNIKDPKDPTGKIDTEFKMKITSEGIQDYFNKDGKTHTLVKYSAKVGDVYQITQSDGKTITRTVTQRSQTDDFPYGFFDIKIITIEQNSRIPGVKKIIYKANHKFGLVYAELVMEDGSKMSTYLYSQNYWF